MQIGRSSCACRAVPDSSGQEGLAQCAAWASGRPTVPIVVCRLAVWFLSGVLRVLLFACLPHSPSREGAGWFLGGPSLGHLGQSPSRRVLRPAHHHPYPPAEVIDGLAVHLPPLTQKGSCEAHSMKGGITTPARAHDFRCGRDLSTGA